MTPLEQMLAEALAQAVNEETARSRPGWHFPEWYQDAAFALAEYARQRQQETNRVNY